MTNEIELLIIGAIISLISSVFGFLAQFIVHSVLRNKGSVKIYTKRVYSKIDSKTWGFRMNSGDMTFSVPVWIEFHNTKDRKEILRNLNLQLYSNNKRIANMTQISHYEKENKKENYANNGSYSFILDPSSISKYDLQFIKKKSEINTNFDTVKLSYYDSKDKYHEIKLLEVKEPWENKKNSIDSDWVLLK